MAAANLPQLLVIDDDDLVRRAVVRVLRRKYSVTELRDAESALALVRAGLRFDAILCDLSLSGMSGQDFFVELDATNREQAQRLVILSGCARSAIERDFLDAVGSRFLEKPASVSEIDAMLEHVVNGVTARAA